MITLHQGEFSAVDDSALVKTGQRAYDDAGNCYIYAKGVASTEAGMWVAFDHDDTDWTTALLTETIGAKGVHVGIAMAATVADKYGWYLIAGKGEGLGLLNNAADAKQYCTATPGALDDGAVSVTAVYGVRLIDTIGGANANATYIINNPVTGETT